MGMCNTIGLRARNTFDKEKKMKKALIFLAVLCLTVVGTMGCPKNESSTSVASSSQGAQLSQQDAIELAESSLKEYGFDFTVEVKDVDGDGMVDYYVPWEIFSENEEVTGINEDLAAVTAVFGTLYGNLAFQVEDVYIDYYFTAYTATMSDCKKCVKLVDADASDQAISDCVNNIWTTTELPE